MVKGFDVKGYTQVGIGYYNRDADTKTTFTEVSVGTNISKNRTFGNAQIGVGDGLSAKAKIGHNFPVGNHTGIEIAGEGEYYQNFETSQCRTNFNYASDSKNVGFAYNHSWHDGYLKGGASAMLTFEGRIGKFGVGVEGGYRKNFAPDININFNASDQNNSVSHSVNYNGREQGAYITPRLEGELNLDKNGRFSLVADATLNEGSAGIRYTF